MAKLLSPGDYNLYTDYTFSDFVEQNIKKYSFGKTHARKLIGRFAKCVHEELMVNIDGFKLPASIGVLIVSGTVTPPKNSRLSSKNKTIYFRNLNTGGVVYGVSYIWGENRGSCKSSVLWKYKSTVPLRKLLFKTIQEGNYDKWLVFERMKDVCKYDIDKSIITKHFRNYMNRKDWNKNKNE